MKSNLPEGWTMRQFGDSVFCFNKLVHWSEMIDPPPDSDGYDDTMSLVVRFHPFQDDSAQKSNHQVLNRINAEIEDLKQHRMDSVYRRGRKGFFDWWGKLVQLQTIQHMFEFVYFKKCSITYSYWELFDRLKNYNEKIDEEAERIKAVLEAYLKDH